MKIDFWTYWCCVAPLVAVVYGLVLVFAFEFYMWWNNRKK